MVTCDDFGKIKLFKYPCPLENSGYYKYSGHTSFVTNVRFTYDSSYVISVGGDELSIFQWRVEHQPQATLKLNHAAID
jgi:echinoderm microtubule-associated protein-like 6